MKKATEQIKLVNAEILAALHKQDAEYEKLSIDFGEIRKAYRETEKALDRTSASILNNLDTILADSRNNQTIQSLKSNLQKVIQSKDLLDRYYEDNKEKAVLMEQLQKAEVAISNNLKKRSSVLARTSKMLSDNKYRIGGLIGTLASHNPLVMLGLEAAQGWSDKKKIAAEKQYEESMNGLYSHRDNLQGRERVSSFYQSKKTGRRKVPPRLRGMFFQNEEKVNEASLTEKATATGRSRNFEKDTVNYLKKIYAGVVNLNISSKGDEELQKKAYEEFKKIGIILDQDEKTQEEMLEQATAQREFAESEAARDKVKNTNNKTGSEKEGLKLKKTPIKKSWFDSIKDSIMAGAIGAGLVTAGAAVVAAIGTLAAGVLGAILVGLTNKQIYDNIESWTKNAMSNGLNLKVAGIASLLIPVAGMIMGGLIGGIPGAIIGTMAGAAMAGLMSDNLKTEFTEAIELLVLQTKQLVQDVINYICDLTDIIFEFTIEARKFLLQKKYEIAMSIPIIGTAATDLLARFSDDQQAMKDIQQSELKLLQLRNTRFTNKVKNQRRIVQIIENRDKRIAAQAAASQANVAAEKQANLTPLEVLRNRIFGQQNYMQGVQAPAPSGNVQAQAAGRTPTDNPNGAKSYEDMLAASGQGRSLTTNSASSAGLTPIQQSVIKELANQGITDPKAVANIMAQIDNESSWNPGAVGDGGDSRGLLQLNKINYPQASKDLGIDLVNHPELANDPANAAKITAWYFKYARNMNNESLKDIQKVNKAVGYQGAGTGGKEDLERANAADKWYSKLNQPIDVRQMAQNTPGQTNDLIAQNASNKLAAQAKPSTVVFPPAKAAAGTAAPAQSRTPGNTRASPTSYAGRHPNTDPTGSDFSMA